MTHRSSIMALVMLAVATMISTAQTQSADVAKVSPEHIRSVTGKVDGDAIRANARTTRDWLSYGLDYAETRFSRLGQINVDNVKALGLVWTYDLESTRGVE